MSKASTRKEIIKIRREINKFETEQQLRKSTKPKAGSLKWSSTLKTCPNADQNMWRLSNPFLDSTCMKEEIERGI